ncbi:MAG TPA: hypothetical protein PKD70_08775 [Saprospiraceae bacterium]|nr:hypothetical protein [Saprospiraceae bacterium]HMP13962.1 hypothetical protein [Saprospiraceae bacterium]
MKFVSMMLALCFALATAAPLMANDVFPVENNNLSVTTAGSKTIVIALKNLQQKRAMLSIEDLDGTIIHYQETIAKRNGYRKTLNLSNLPVGKYLLVVKEGGRKYQQVIVISKSDELLLSAIR